MAQYRLKCMHPDCGKIHDVENDYRLKCAEELEGKHGPALLRTLYDSKELTIRDELPGIFKYADWLPVGENSLNIKQEDLGRPICYKSYGLADRLDLKHLYIAFSGYHPLRGANLITRTFKEFECQVSIGRLAHSYQQEGIPPLLICSAGNTANGFNLMAYLMDFPVYLVVPESGLDKLVLPYETKAKLVAVKGDYSDAIDLSNGLAQATEFVQDGGALNVGRRGGMGAVMLHAVTHPREGLHKLYDHYFQAVGSASGAIAAWEACQLLKGDGRFGNTTTHIHMAQNYPFTPIAESWKTGNRKLRDLPYDDAKKQISSVAADVLTNRNPPYEMPGGIYDVLTESDGFAWQVNNYDIFQAARMFSITEGVDIGPSAAVAVDALRQAVEAGAVKSDEHVLLHVTGGGREIQHSESSTWDVKPIRYVDVGAVDDALDAFGELQPPTDIDRILVPYGSNS